MCGLSCSNWEKQEGGVEENSAFAWSLRLCLHGCVPCYLAIVRLASVPWGY